MIPSAILYCVENQFCTVLWCFWWKNAQNGVERSEVEPLGETQRSGTEWALALMFHHLIEGTAICGYPNHSLGVADERNVMGTERSVVGMKCSEGSDPSQWNRGLGAKRKGHYETAGRGTKQ